MAGLRRTGARLSTLAVASAAMTGGIAVAAGTAYATTPTAAPTVSEHLSAAAGGTTDANGNLTTQLVQGVAAVEVGYSIGADSGQTITSAQLNCGGTIPAIDLLALPHATAPGSISGDATCTYQTRGSFTPTIVAMESGAGSAPGTASHTVTVTLPTMVDVNRFYGNTRYGTGVAASQAAFPTAGSAGAVVLARGDQFADALAGIPLAKAKNGPLLLTPGGLTATSLDPNVKTELERVLPKGRTVYVLGGVAALPQPVADQISALGYTVVRLSGQTRFDTALDIAQDPRALNNPTTIVVARGDDFADALAAGPFAADRDVYNGKPAAIVLSNGPAATAALDPATAAYVNGKLAETTQPGDYTVTAIGGGAAAAVGRLSATAAADMAGQGGTNAEGKAIVGATRYDTAAYVAKAGWGTAYGYSPGVEGVVSGTSFPDALTGGAYMAAVDGPLLLTATGQLPPATAVTLAASGNTLSNVQMFGGPVAVQPTVVTEIRQALQPRTVGYSFIHLAF